MKNNNYKIDFEIYIAFIIVISISVFNAIYSSMNISKNQDATSKIMVVDVPSLQALENMNLLITKSKCIQPTGSTFRAIKKTKESSG
ncbi:MAG: hypothetical protein IPL69_20025 [Saprospiraceae bacterium]|nr:hypothetical protein [Candidatus Brachybacter algidus]